MQKKHQDIYEIILKSNLLKSDDIVSFPGIPCVSCYLTSAGVSPVSIFSLLVDWDRRHQQQVQGPAK